MYLKSIEMQGFKSFADKTKVVFDQGVTAVVGPNGSGKSNITESLRWALGESSAKSLRGGKMPDVIFAGTEHRKALNYASVVVTLDNSEGYIAGKNKEIRVERHIYRSGDSEYKIDGQKVRLRDVHDLFMDTGLGRDSFSIISQGRVEEIFNSKPEERRAIFEEAAGVLKYKSRKKETETKLAQTQDNLDRLEDILYELESQLAPLEKQAAVAKEFLLLEEERSSLQLDVLVAQMSHGRKRLDQTQTELDQVRVDLSAYYQQRDRLEHQHQELKEKRQTVLQDLDKEQALLLDLTKLISDLERKIEVYQLEANQTQSQKQDAQERLKTLQDRIASYQAEWAQKEERMQELRQQLTELEGKLQAVEEEIGHFSEDPDQVMEHLREQYVETMQEAAQLSNALTRVEQERERQEALAESQSSELANLKADVAAARQQEEEVREVLAQAEQTLGQLLADYREGEQAVAGLKSAYQTKQEELFAHLDQLKNKQARQSSLEAILKNHSNFYAGVKAVLQEAPKFGGIIGAVSEQLSFEETYQTALEIALGGASQHVIVEDEATAKAAISFLKRSRQGRATFLPVTTIKARHLPGHHLRNLEQAPGFLGCASDLVTYPERLAAIFQNLLGTVAVFDTIEHANQAARATQFQVRMVTLDGSEIRTGGAFAGGTNRTNQTTFIKPELERLGQEIADLHQVIAQQEAALSKEKAALATAQLKLQEIASKGEAARLEEQKQRLYLEQASQRLLDLIELYAAKQAGLGQLDAYSLEEQAAKLKVQIGACEEKQAQLLAQIEELKDNREAIQERLQDLQDRRSDLVLKQTQLRSEWGFAQTEAERLAQEVASSQAEEQILQELIDQKVERLDDSSIEQLTDQLSEAQTRKDVTSQSLIRLRFELEDIEGQTEDISEQMDKARAKNEELIRAQTRLEATCEQVQDQLRQLLLQLSETYQMSVEEAQAKARPLDNREAAEQDLKNLERKIRSLGPVNIEAIDQYQEVFERVSFLTSQKDDVLAARQLLLDTIHDMDEEVIARFKVTFEAIRESFQQTFRQIFGGGRADLLLTTSDWLTAGVEISVQPPGKKIQSLNLMSGGEKALSALALLFSIIRVKTIPFVILDEVEAALDEANVKRFGDYLNRFDKSSQFIVVTHRKGTMAAADSIYGVTMQESGVSKIVSVKLKEAEKLTT